MVRALVAGAVLALAATVSRAEDTVQWTPPANGNIHLPVTPNDFGTMIFTLLESQLSFLAGKEGVDTEGSPANLMAQMAHYLMQAQQSFFKEAAPMTGDELTAMEASTAQAAGTQFDNIVPNHNITFPFHNDTFPGFLTKTVSIPGFIKALPDAPAIDYNSLFFNATKALGIANRTDPISQDLLNLLIQDPAGPELQGAFAALPNIPDPVSLGTANFSSGTYGAGVNGSRNFVTIGSTLINYRPCFFQGNEGGVGISPALIQVTPRILQVQPYGVEIDPKLLEIAPRIVTVKPIGVNVQPLGIQVSPVLINVSPKVNYYHPYVPGVPGSGK